MKQSSNAMWPNKYFDHQYDASCHFYMRYSDVIMGAMPSQIASPAVVYSTVYSGADQGKKSKLHVTGLCAGKSPVTGEFPALPVTRKIFPFDDVIMDLINTTNPARIKKGGLHSTVSLNVSSLLVLGMMNLGLQVWISNKSPFNGHKQFTKAMWYIFSVA